MIFLVNNQLASTQWQPSNNGMNGVWVNSVFVEDNNIIIGTKGPFILTSSDFGENWKEILLEDTSNGIVSVILNNGIYIACSNGSGVVVSSDNGKNWTKKNTGLTNTNVLSLASGSSKIYAGTSGGEIFITNDNCESWSKLYPKDSIKIFKKINTITVFDNNILIGTNNGVFLSTDEGNNWIQKNSGLFFDPLLIYSLVINGEYVYAATYRGLFRSSLEKIVWEEYQIGTVTAQFVTVAVEDSIIITGRSGDLFISKNGGKSWDNKKFLHEIQDLKILNKEMYCGTIGGIYKSTDLGESWIDLNKGIGNTLINTITANSNGLYAATYGNGVFISSDNGDNWKEINSGLENSYSTSFTNSIISEGSEVYLASMNGFYYSSDSGKNWINKKYKNENLPISLNLPISTIIKKDNIIYAGSWNEAGVIITSDNGDTWQTKSNGVSTASVGLASDGENLFSINSDKGGFYFSSDDGDNWKQKNADMNVNYYCIHYKNNKLLIGGEYGKLSSSLNKGDSWNNLEISSIFDSKTILYAIETIGSNIFAGTNQGLYYSSDNGNNWILKNDGLKSKWIMSLKIKGDTIYAGSYYGGMHRARLSDFGITSVEENQINNDNYLYTFPPFPNPATKEVRSLVYWDMSSDIEQDEIGVYNIYGAKVSDRSKISFDKLSAYNGYLIWNCTGMETGVYMIVIKHGTETRTIKVIVN